MMRRLGLRGNHTYNHMKPSVELATNMTQYSSLQETSPNTDADPLLDRCIAACGKTALLFDTHAHTPAVCKDAE
jgi:hypothetical protein